MSNLYIDTERAYVVDHAGNRFDFLDMQNVIENKSKIPMHILNNGTGTIINEKTILGVLLNLRNKFQQLFNTNDETLSDKLFIFDMFIAKSLIKTALPVNVCEIGCDNGLLSWHISEVVGKFNSDSTYCLVGNSIGNDGNNGFLDTISLCDNPPELSITISDYHKTNLQSDNFDIIVINGTVILSDFTAILKEAERLVKNDGTIICFADQNPLLEEAFKSYFDNYNEFYISPSLNVIRVCCDKSHFISDHDIFQMKINNIKSDLHNDITYEENLNAQKFEEYFSRLKELIDYAVSNREVENKIHLINIHELLADYKVHINTPMKEIYKDKLINIL